VPQATKRQKTSVLRPLADHVVIRPIEETAEKKGSLFIPDTAKEKPQQGEVIAVGPGRFEKGQRAPMELAVGNRVLYGKYSGTEVVIDQHEYLIVRENDVLGVVC
jgi:chaperonin GroES